MEHCLFNFVDAEAKTNAPKSKQRMNYKKTDGAGNSARAKKLVALAT